MSDTVVPVPGWVVQIAPEPDLTFGGCFMVVTEVKGWGYVGYVQPPAKAPGGLAFYRVPFDQCAAIGPAAWTITGTRDPE